MSRRDQRGTAVIEVTWLTVLLLVPLVYVVAAVFETQQAAFAVTQAAKAAGRAYVTAPSEASARARARAAARLALRDQGVEPTRVELRFTCTPRPRNCLSPGSTVRVEAGYDVPLPLMPRALGSRGASVSVTAEHAEPYGTYREDR